MVTTAPRLSSTTLAYLKRELLLREGHFEFRSGYHANALLDRDRLLAEPEISSKMGYSLAKKYFTDKIHTVATPSIWGAGLAQWIGYFLDPRAKVVHATPMKNSERRIAENLHDMIDGHRILLVDNLIISGATLSDFASEVSGVGGEIIGVCTLWDLAHPDIQGHDVFGLLDDIYPSWLPDECPVCASGNHDVEQIPY